MDWLHIVYYLVLLALLLTGLFLNVLGLPGLWVMLASLAGYAWVTESRYIGWWWILALVAVALVAEVMEFVAGSAGAAKAGGSKRGMIGAIVGGLLGGFLLTIPVPILGTIVGVIAGTFIGAWVVEVMIGKEVGQSTEIGFGAAKGRLYGTIIKLTFGGIIFLLATWRAFPAGGAPITALPPATQPAMTQPAPMTTAPATAPTETPATTPAVER